MILDVKPIAILSDCFLASVWVALIDWAGFYIGFYKRIYIIIVSYNTLFLCL